MDPLELTLRPPLPQEIPQISSQIQQFHLSLDQIRRPPLPQEIPQIPSQIQQFHLSLDQIRAHYPIFNAIETENSNPPAPAGPITLGSRKRKTPPQKPRKRGKMDTIPKPYKWAQNRRAKIYNLESLNSMEIKKISGEVHCKKCDQTYEMEYDLETKFNEIASYIAKNKSGMHDRAPSKWMTPVLPDCEMCKQKNCVKPVQSDKKKEINWLFLLLGEMLGCCKLAELKYFCKHTENHRTGAKDRVLYLTYLGLCKQLDPNGPFSLDD